MSYRKYEDIICREDCVEETVSKEDVVNTPKLCPNYARGSKNNDIEKEVRFKTLSLLNTLPKPKEISPITEYY